MLKFSAPLFLSCLLNVVGNSGKCYGLGATSCPQNEEYVPCINRCNTCEYLGHCVQILLCTPGCDCKPGYFRNENGYCVLKEQCYKKCKANEVYLTCGTACPLTCENYMNPPEFCTLQCIEGCFCKNGYVRNKNNQCVLPQNCNKGVCGVNEKYYNCTPSCKNTCQNYFNPGIRCRCGPPGCFCVEGLVKNDGGLCVPPYFCPQRPPDFCGPNEIYTNCVNPCNDCVIKGNCQFLACNEGCDCLKDFYRDRRGRCIPENRCPGNRICKGNEVYRTCGTACPLTCENYKNPPSVCTLQCVEGCFCKDGFVRDRNNRCVLPKDCHNSKKSVL